MDKLKRIGLYASVVLLVAGCCRAQDFAQLLEAVDRMESRLKAQVESECKARKESVARLESMFRSRADSAATPDRVDVQALEAQIAQLRAEVEAMKMPVESPRISSDSLWPQLLADIEYLRAECRNLRQDTSRNAGSQIASLEEFGVPSMASDAGSAGVENSTAGRPSPIVSNLALSGFVDASQAYDDGDRENSFGLDQVEVDISRSLGERAKVRADIELMADGNGHFGTDLEQGYLTFDLGRSATWQVTFGKFNAPIGFELLDAPDMYQYSHALVFVYGLPTNLTGLMLSAKPNSWFDTKLYIVNGWDATPDNNNGKTIGTRLGVTLSPSFAWGLSAITGPEVAGSTTGPRTVIDWDAAYTPTEQWTIGGELQLGTEQDALGDGRDGRWQGGLVTAHWRPDSRYGVTARLDYLNDKDGSRTGVAQEWKAILIAPSLVIVEGLTCLLETRYDWSDKKSFANSHGDIRDRRFSGAVEFTCGF